MCKIHLPAKDILSIEIPLKIKHSIKCKFCIYKFIVSKRHNLFKFFIDFRLIIIYNTNRQFAKS